MFISPTTKILLAITKKKNRTSFQLLAIVRNRVASRSKIKKVAVEGNKIACLSRIESGIKSANSDLQDIKFSIEK